MLELRMRLEHSGDGRDGEHGLPRPRGVRAPSVAGTRLLIGRDPKLCRPLTTPHDWLFVSRRHLVFEHTDERGWTVEWPRGKRDQPVALVRIEIDGVPGDMPYGAVLPLRGRGTGVVTVSDLARRRHVVVAWHALGDERGPGPLDGPLDRRAPDDTVDATAEAMRERLRGVRLEVLTAMACDWNHGRLTKRPRTTDELCEMLYMAKATVERCKTDLRREFYVSNLCPELNALLGPRYLDTTPHVHGGWDLIAQTAVTCGIVGREPCPCTRRGGPVG